MMPTLGYRSVTDAVLALRAAGMSIEAVADKVDRSPIEVRNLEYSGLRTRRRREGVILPSVTLRRLRDAAVARGISVDQLAQRILNVVAIGGLVEAVLDDAPSNSGAGVGDPGHG